MARAEREIRIEPAASAPRYELRVRRHRPGAAEYAVWQLPAPATPQMKRAQRVARLHGANLDLIEHRVLRRLARAGVRLGPRAGGADRGYPLPEEAALLLGLLFRALAPMRNRDNMRMVTAGIEAMEPEEAAYWAGMAIHRRRPRRVLKALRILLTDCNAGRT